MNASLSSFGARSRTPRIVCTVEAQPDAKCCPGCRPMPAVVEATSQEHAVALIRRARKVAVWTRMTEHRAALFWVTKKTAIQGLAQLPPNVTPRLSFHVDGSCAFLGCS